MNLIARLRALNHASPNEKVLIAYILGNASACVDLKPKVIAERAFVSISTFYRLSDKLGYNGIHEFQMDLLAAIKEMDKLNLSIDFDYPIDHDDSIAGIGDHLKDLYNKTIEETRAHLDEQTLLQLRKFLIERPKWVLFTGSANIYLAKNFRFQMKEIGIDVLVPEEDYMQRLCATNCDDESFAIVLSFAARGNTIQRVLPILNDNHVPYLTITAEPDLPLFKGSSLKLMLPPLENHYNKISSFSTRLSMLYMLDVIYADLFHADYRNNVQKKLAYFAKMNIK